MYKIIQVTDSVSLDELRKALAQAHSLRVTIEGTQVSFKVNGGIWSAPMGQLDPECQAAQAIWCEECKCALPEHYSNCSQWAAWRKSNEMACCTSSIGPICNHRLPNIELPETEEPEMCWCGRHYASLNHNEYVRM